MSPCLVAVRHAPPGFEGVCYGRADVPVLLSDADAAKSIAAAISSERPLLGRVWASPATRCCGPARLVARDFGLELTVDDRLSELAFGAWEGRTWVDIEANDGEALGIWMRSWLTNAPPGGETVAELENRVREWYRSLEQREGHLLVGHAGVIRALRVITGRCTWPEAMGREVVPLRPEAFSE